MTASGKKKEEYREIKPYWIHRLCWHEFHGLNPADIIGMAKAGHPIFKTNYDVVEEKNGYAQDAPMVEVEFKGIDIGPAVPEWSDNWQGDVFRIKLGKVLSIKNQS